MLCGKPTIRGTMKRFAIVAGLALLALGPLGAGSAVNRPLAGDLDSSFGTGGIVSLGSNIGGIAVQPDGRIVVAGGGLLARYLPNGSPDPSFGGRGSVATEVERSPFSAQLGVALQSDGKIVVAGSGPVQGDERNFSAFTLARYNPNGSLDTSFGTDGITKTVIPETGPFLPGTEAGARSLVILPDGEILAGGAATWDNGAGLAANFVLAGYTPNGSLDPTFGEGGIVQTSFYGDDWLDEIVVQPDGKVVATGTGALGGHGQDIATMALARYAADGSVDPTFGTDGKVTTDAKLRYEGGPSALQGRKIVVAGETENKEVLVLARYRTDGRLDATFGKHGFVEIKRVTGLPTAVLVQNDRKILIATSGASHPNRVARLLPSGRLDTSFGKRGIVSLGDGPPLYIEAPYGLALQADQKILVGGGGGRSSTLARLIGGNNCVVPGLRGKTMPKARARLRTSYCSLGHVSKRFSRTVIRGRVIAAAPKPDTRLPNGAKVDLVISNGTPR
jgi:uncharacterized delta-60 repeat protein